MLEFNCTSCSQRLTVAESAAGKKCRCGNCGQIVDAPRTVSVAAPTAGIPSPASTHRPDSSHPLGERPAAPSARPITNAPAFDEPTLPPIRQRPEFSLPPAISRDADRVSTDFLAPPQSPDEIGRLGGYRILKVLGSGGMGTVFHAEDVQLKRSVALKTMLPELAASAANRERFLREAQAAAALEHDRIVTIYQVGEDRGVPFIAMQLLQGEPLETRLRIAGRLNAVEVLRIARETALGLAVAHERGLIHRDIKPSNIWLETLSDGGGRRVKILDFGLVRSLTDDSSQTRSGTIVGTPAYMAPEQARGRTVDGRTDLFGLGCVLYRACTGQLPFHGPDTIATLMLVAEHAPTPPDQLHTDIPPRLSQLIMTLLAKDPAARPSSARIVVRAIQEIERGFAPDRTDVEVSVPPPLPLTARIDSPSSHSSQTNVETLLLIPEPAGDPRKKWLVVAGLFCGGAGLALLVFLGIVLYLFRGGKAKPDGEGPVPAAAPQTKKGPINAELQKILHDAVQQKNYTKSNLIGFPHAPEFTEIPPEGALLIGFEVGLGKFINNDVINSLRAIYLNEKGEFFGQIHGKPTDRLVTVKAKEGYAIGAVSINAHLLLDGLRITFMRIDRKYLDADQSYAEKVASVDAAGKEPSLGGGGAPVIGICGRDDGRVCNCLGFVLRGKGGI